MSDIKQHVVEAVTNISAKVATGTGVGVAGVSAAKKGIEGSHVAVDGWGLSEWGIVGGLAVSVLSLLIQSSVSWYFNSKRLESERNRNQQLVDLAKANVQPVSDRDDGCA